MNEDTLPEVFGSFRLRAIGGGPLERARLFRSAQLADISPDEAVILTKKLGIASIFDVRSDREVLEHPEPYLVGAKTVHLTPSAQQRRKNASQRLVAGVIGQYGVPEQRMISNYRRYVDEYPLLSRALRTMAAEQVKALVHCVNGKDRTGVICAVIMRTCGAHPDDIMADYLRTNDVNAETIATEAKQLGAGMTREERDILMSFLEARPAYLNAYFDEVNERYATFDRYLTDGVRLTFDQIDRLQALYLGQDPL